MTLLVLLALFSVPIMLGSIAGFMAIRQDVQKPWYEPIGHRHIPTNAVDVDSEKQEMDVSYLLNEEDIEESEPLTNVIYATSEMPSDDEFTSNSPSLEYETSQPDQQTENNLDELLSHFVDSDIHEEPAQNHSADDHFFIPPHILEPRDHQAISDSYGEEVANAITATPNMADDQETTHVLIGRLKIFNEDVKIHFKDEHITLIGNLPEKEQNVYLIRGQFVSEASFHVLSFVDAEDVAYGNRPIHGLYEEEVS